jgi:hypothetical protein
MTLVTGVINSKLLSLIRFKLQYILYRNPLIGINGLAEFFWCPVLLSCSGCPVLDAVVGKVTVIKLLRYVTSYFFK